MFADSFVDVSWADRSRRSFTTLITLGVESVMAGVLLLMPLLYVQGLPHLERTAALISPPPAPMPMSPHIAVRQAGSNLNNAGQMMTPPTIPEQVLPVVEHFAPPPVDVRNLGVRGGTGERLGRNGVLNSTGDGLGEVTPPPVAPVAQQTLRVSHIMEGNLIHRVQPEYPAIAREAHVQGSVVLRALISREGRIENLQILSGHPMLVRAAMDAVRQWRYRPYQLNGEPVEVETEITVNFTLAGG